MRRRATRAVVGVVSSWALASSGCDPSAVTPLDAESGFDARVEVDAAARDGGAFDVDAGDVGARDRDAGGVDAGSVDGGAEVDASSPFDGGDDAGAGDDAGSALDPSELAPGGATTTSRVDALAYQQPAANLPIARRGPFEIGRSFFDADWVAAPGLADRDGLGPTFNAVSCLACHTANGRAAPPSSEASALGGLLLRIGGADGTADPRYGDQVQPLSVAGVPAEGAAVCGWTPVEHTWVDGHTTTLTRLDCHFTPALGDALADLRVSPRIANAMVGLGLLEAIAEADLAALADPDDLNGDGISGRLHVRDGVLGRFGWKAGQPSVRAQSAAAFLGDLGITTTLHPSENCPAPQALCASAANGGSPEVDDARLAATAAYVELLGVPARRDATSDASLEGRALFRAIGCASCHTPSFVTGPATQPELEGQTIWPYSDLLLHDLGEPLADHRGEGDASGTEWRTAPLWGVGLARVVNGHLQLLHDGRANGVEEAILWHDGEADASRLAYERLTSDERAALVRFVESL